MNAAEPTSHAWRFPGCPEPPGWRLDFAALAERFDWLRRMAGCPQDPIWHAEGDVLTHVDMVCAAMVGLRAWRELPVLERHVVFAAALLHDVAKPLVTRAEDGRIRSRGHALRGARAARRILMEDTAAFGPAGTPLGVREQVVALVRHHGLPATLLDKPDPTRAVITASMTARCDLLAMLAEADARGRICLSADDSADRVACFAEFCREVGCAAGPYPFASDHSRFVYFHSVNQPPTLHVYDGDRFDVTVLSGLPGAGKDTWVRTRGDDLPAISLDDVRDELGVDAADDQGPVVLAAKERAKALLRARRPFVWNATNTSRPLREGVINLMANYGARVRVVYCEAPLPELLERNAARRRPVPGRVIDKLLDHMDVPDLTEAHAVTQVA
jgi:predicted kinase